MFSFISSFVCVCVFDWLIVPSFPSLPVVVCLFVYQIAGVILSYCRYAFPTELSKTSDGKTRNKAASKRASLIYNQ